MEGHATDPPTTTTIRGRTFMGITDRLRDLTKKAEDTASEHKEQIQEAVQKVQSTADQRTGGRYSEQIQKVGAKAQTLVDRLEDPAKPHEEAKPGEEAEPHEEAKGGEEAKPDQGAPPAG
jgi:gas vesicle protein